MNTNYQSRCRQIHFRIVGIACGWTLGVIAALLCSCASEQPTSGNGGTLAPKGSVVYPKDMEGTMRNRISQIHVGMTFAEVAQILRIYTNGLQLVEHGGTWFNAAAGTNWIVMLRFVNASVQPEISRRKLNFQPLIRARVPDEASW